MPRSRVRVPLAHPFAVLCQTELRRAGSASRCALAHIRGSSRIGRRLSKLVPIAPPDSKAVNVGSLWSPEYDEHDNPTGRIANGGSWRTTCAINNSRYEVRITPTSNIVACVGDINLAVRRNGELLISNLIFFGYSDFCDFGSGEGEINSKFGVLSVALSVSRKVAIFVLYSHTTDSEVIARLPYPRLVNLRHATLLTGKRWNAH